MAIERRRTLQELLASIASGAAPIYGGNANLQRQATPRPGGQNIGMTIGPSMPTVDYGSGPVTARPGALPQKTPEQLYQERVWINDTQWHSPGRPDMIFGPPDYTGPDLTRGGGDPFQPNQGLGKDVVPTYQDVNPFIWDQRTGQPSKTYFNEYIQLLTDRHPNFATEYKANPQAALSKYESESGLYGDLNVAQDYHYGIDPMSGGPMRDTPQFQMMLLNTPAMIDQNIKDYGIDAVYGPLVRPNTITTESSLAGMGGLLDPDVAANNGGGILGTV